MGLDPDATSDIPTTGDLGVVNVGGQPPPAPPAPKPSSGVPMWVWAIGAAVLGIGLEIAGSDRK
jgi:hypothetical protein